MKVAVLAVVLILSSYTHAIAQEFDWAASQGGAGFDTGYGLAIDDQGNVFTIGSFQGTADFDPGPQTFEMSSAGFDDIFISKSDASGNFLWAKRMGGPSFDIGYDITIDSEGNVYSTGYFSETVDFNPGAASNNLTSIGLYDCFISKLDNDGNFLWAQQIGGEEFEMGFAITCDGPGNIYVTGRFNGTADFDPGAGVTSLSPAGSYDAFVVKLDSMGALAWARNMGGNADDEGHGINIDDAGNVITTGFFWGAADFDPGSATTNLTSAGNFDVYLSKLNSTGDFVWAKRIGGDMEDQGLAMAMDSNQDILLTGYYSSTADFDPSAGTFEMTSEGAVDAYICKLDVDGEFIWARSIGSFGNDKGYSIAVGSDNAVYSCGSFEFGVDLDPGSGTDLFLSNGGIDAYQNILSASGDYIWSAQIGGGDDDRAIHIDLDAFDNILTTGFYQLTADFDPSANTQNLTASANYDAFVQKLLQCESSEAGFSATACNSYESPSGNYTWSTSGVYMDTIPNAAGCDSILTISLTINTTNTGVTQSNDSLIADAIGATYQWLDCNGTTIPGATQQGFLPEAEGTYAVIVTEACTDTSDCIAWTVGIGEYDISDEIQLQFDPRSEDLIIDLGKRYNKGMIAIYSISGQLQHETSFTGTQIVYLERPQTPGLYIISVYADDRVGTLRMVQE